jgi:hypothetical protein
MFSTEKLVTFVVVGFVFGLLLRSAAKRSWELDQVRAAAGGLGLLVALFASFATENVLWGVVTFVELGIGWFISGLFFKDGYNKKEDQS